MHRGCDHNPGEKLHQLEVNLLAKLSHFVNIHFALLTVDHFNQSEEAKQDLTKLLSFGFRLQMKLRAKSLENFLKAFPCTISPGLPTFTARPTFISSFTLSLVLSYNSLSGLV